MSRSSPDTASPSELVLSQDKTVMTLPLKEPYLPMEAKSAMELPVGGNWQYEPKWDGFRCLAFRDGDKVSLQSKSGQPLGRYFPELVDVLSTLTEKLWFQSTAVSPLTNCF